MKMTKREDKLLSAARILYINCWLFPKIAEKFSPLLTELEEALLLYDKNIKVTCHPEAEKRLRHSFNSARKRNLKFNPFVKNESKKD